MARTEFTDEELKKRLFVEFIKHPDGGERRGLVEFHGFYTENALLRSRKAREFAAHQAKFRSGREVLMSDYLFFLAELFADLEQRETNLRDTTCPATGRPCTRGCYDINRHSAGYCEQKAIAEHPNMARWETEGP